MKMQGPEGVCSASVNGVSLSLDEDGCVDVDKGVAAELASHGFVQYKKPEQVQEKTATVSVDDSGEDEVPEVHVKANKPNKAPEVHVKMGKPKPTKTRR